MIFKRLFSPSHTSKDPAVRKSAIDKLSADKQQDKSILHELAFNDADAQVTLAALHKLNSFALWQKSAQQASHEQVQRTARQFIENAVLADTHPGLTARQRTDYLLETASVDLVKAALLKPVAGLSDDVILQLLSKINRDDFTLSYYQQSAAPSVRQRMVAQTDDPQLLEKFSRRETDDSLLNSISDKLARFAETKKMPELVSRQVTLILAKLKALSERANYTEVAERRAVLLNEYEEIRDQLHWLDEAQQQDTATKYQQLCDQTNRHLERLKPEHEAAVQRALRAERLTSAQQAVAQVKQQIENLYLNNPATATVAQIEQGSNSLQQAQHVMALLAQAPEADGALAKDLHLLTRELAVQQEYLEQFTQQQQYCQQLGDILAQTDSVITTSDNTTSVDTELFAQLQQQWQAIAGQVFVVPKQYQQQWNTLQRTVKQQQQAESTRRDKALKGCRRQLNIIDNMIEQGKFRAAMSRFSQLNKDIEALSAADRQALARRYESTQKQVERLEGWQTYLAAPRKPELLEQAQQLAQAAPQHIGDRAKAIKALRQQWQSLTSPGDDSEQSQAFDVALEQAFEPCRVFYAQQEAERAQARTEREQLIAEVGELDTEQAPAQLQQAIEALKQRWRNAGQVDKNDYEQLKQQWEMVLNAPAEKVNVWHQQNREQKQALITSAQALLDGELQPDTAAQAQALQQQWKLIGHAGRRHESKLWKNFKSINDALFAQLKSNSQAQRTAQDQQTQMLVDQANELQQQLSPETLAEVRVSAALLQRESEQRQGPQSKVMQRALRQLQDAVIKTEHQSRQQARAQQYQALLSALEHYNNPQQDAGSQIDEAKWQGLSRAHQQALLAESPEKPRRWYTTKLEILADLPTPADDKSLRHDIQLAMMMARLEQGDESELDEVILSWVSCGAIDADQQPLFTRFKMVIEQVFFAESGSSQDVSLEHS
ncbi:DUF349 domain-containing protein [Salinimonas marina]|uniref:DUF349 domain-containing protein n=1 Tax=Salinimonas marina TaxID=2785918 RepID=A0A7S9DZU3_9ALTE|nr:DUF349 domain-containing protein [Salinimonas marina]QPG06872.1 DUF349 domain-containing protein [Salinimonas marina]